jgi:hypothetical protein
MLKAVISLVTIMTLGGSARAADYAVTGEYRPRYREAVADICHLNRCTPRGCRIVNVCRCPDRYSCHGIYDAYGPYGGRAYLGGYTRLD